MDEAPLHQAFVKSVHVQGSVIKESSTEGSSVEVMCVQMSIKAQSLKGYSQELISMDRLPPEMVAKLHFRERHRGIGAC